MNTVGSVAYVFLATCIR